jgi:predicted MPP superfamily phosphohydrolase
LTGDYRKDTKTALHQFYKSIENISRSIKARDGIIAVLGNTDTYRILPPFTAIGIRTLINETRDIYRGNEKISITGIDDPHSYFSDRVVDAIEKGSDGFKILAAHSPEIYDLAAKSAYDLYLSGHTHGGQICLPGGTPLMTSLNSGRFCARGEWNFRGMKGYTSQGCGTAFIPIRFNSQSEIALIELRRN